MTFESLAVAGLSIGLSMNDILNTEIGLIYGLVNTKNNIYHEQDRNSNETIIQGDAEMLKRM